MLNYIIDTRDKEFQKLKEQMEKLLSEERKAKKKCQYATREAYVFDGGTQVRYTEHIYTFQDKILGETIDTSTQDNTTDSSTAETPSTNSPSSDIITGLTSGYQAKVTRSGGSSGFRDEYSPSNLPSQDDMYTLGYTAGSDSANAMRFFLPPGVRAFTANFLVYLTQTPTKGVMKFQQPPNTFPQNVTQSMVMTTENSGGPYGGLFDETILKNLLNKKEVFLYGDAGAGLMPISYGGVFLTPQKEGGWLYCNFDYVPGALGSTQWNVWVDKSIYEKWYKSAKWDSSGNPSEQHIHSVK